MRIKDIPKEGRPRERFMAYGAESLSDAELFAVLLGTGWKRLTPLRVLNPKLLYKERDNIIK